MSSFVVTATAALIPPGGVGRRCVKVMLKRAPQPGLHLWFAGVANHVQDEIMLLPFPVYGLLGCVPPDLHPRCTHLKLALSR